MRNLFLLLTPFLLGVVVACEKNTGGGRQPETIESIVAEAAKNDPIVQLKARVDTMSVANLEIEISLLEYDLLEIIQTEESSDPDGLDIRWSMMFFYSKVAKWDVYWDALKRVAYSRVVTPEVKEAEEAFKVCEAEEDILRRSLDSSLIDPNRRPELEEFLDIKVQESIDLKKKLIMLDMKRHRLIE